MPCVHERSEAARRHSIRVERGKGTAGREGGDMKTCEFCGGSRVVVRGDGSNVLDPCPDCSGAGKVEAVGRHTSLTLPCALIEPDYLRLSENGDLICVELAAMTSGEDDSMTQLYVQLDAESESRLLAWLKARSDERQSP